MRLHLFAILLYMITPLVHADAQRFYCLDDSVNDPTHVYVHSYSFKDNDMAKLCYREDGHNIQLLYGLKKGESFNLGETQLNTSRTFQSGYYQLYISNLSTPSEYGFLGFSKDSNNFHIESLWEQGEKHHVYHPIFSSGNKAHFLIETSYHLAPLRGLEFSGLKIHKHENKYEDSYSWRFLKSLNYKFNKVDDFEFFTVDVPKSKICYNQFPCRVEIVAASSTHHVFIPTVVDSQTADDMTDKTSLILNIRK